jgi:hypothetical protein
MKIGFSLGRCVRDIVNGKLSVDDVAFIIAATRIQDKSGLDWVIEEYGIVPEYLRDCDIDKAKEVAHVLWDTGRILQPRLQGVYRHKQPEGSIWVDIFPTALSDSDAVKRAWDGYRFMLHMVENVDTEAIEDFKKV